MSENGSKIKIDVFSDVVCPWCFVGITRLERVIASFPHPYRFEVELHPFLLRPQTPPEGINISEMLRTKYGADPKTMFARVEAAAKESNLALDLQKQAFMYSSVGAHTLLRHALARGTQRELSRALFEAYFHEAKNIADVDVLSEIASAHGFSNSEAQTLLQDANEEASTKHLAHEASQEGITGVPFFVFAQKYAVNGAQPEEVLRKVLERVLAEA